MDFEADTDRTLISRKPWVKNLKAGKEAMKNGEYDEAERLLKLALSEAERFDTEDPRTANICNNLAQLCSKQGKVDEAEYFYKEVIKLWESTLGPNYSGLTEVFDGYAQLLYKHDREEEGDEMRQRSRTIRDRLA